MPHPEYGLKENAFYIGAPKKFIAGTVAYSDTDECAGGMTVTLSGTNGKTKTVTNNFGDFEFESLPDNIEYTVKFEAPKYKPQELHAKTQTDVYMGVIMLEK